MKATCAVLLSLLLTATAAATVHTQLEPRLVDEMETVQLILRIEGQAQADAPDLSPLHQDFEVLGTQTSSRISSINGRTTAMVEYQINLRPTRTGELRIPALDVGGEKSQEVTLVVRPLDPGLRQTIENMVFFESDVSVNPVYVQAQTVLTRRLYYSNGVQIYSDLPGVPDIADAVVIPLGDTRSFSTLRDGLRYGVIEQRFAVFPERSGPLTIAPISVTSSVRLNSGGRVRRSGIRVSTTEISLDVLPIPESYPTDAPWLPATNLQLSHRWAPEHASIDVGSQLDLTVRVTVEGNTSSAIPPLALQLPDAHFKIYPEAPQLEEATSTETVTGSRQQHYALVPTAPGQVALEPVSMIWWDTNTNRVRTASLPAHSISLIGPALPTPDPAQISAAEPAQDSPAEHSMPTADTQPATSSPPGLNLTARWRDIGLGAAAATLVAFGLLLAWRLRIRPGSKSKRSAIRAHLRAFDQAIRSGDPASVRRSLGRYLEHRYQLTQPMALRRFSQVTGAADQIDALDAMLYGSTEVRCDFARLKQAVQEAERIEQSRETDAARQTHRNLLPPLSA